jgi:exosome complex exonuclease DIS3/RRP44
VLVSQVKTNGLIVFVPKFGIEGPVYFTPQVRNSNKETAGKQHSHRGSGGGSTNKRSNDKAGADEDEQAFILDEETQSVASRYSTLHRMLLSGYM